MQEYLLVLEVFIGVSHCTVIGTVLLLSMIIDIDRDTPIVLCSSVLRMQLGCSHVSIILKKSDQIEINDVYMFLIYVYII